MKKTIIISLALSALLFSCDNSKKLPETTSTPNTTAVKPDDHGHDDHGHEHGPNGGDIKEIENAGYIEYFLNEANATMTINLFQKDKKTPLNVAEAPKLTGKYRENRVSAPFEAEKMPNHQFKITHAILSAHVGTYVVVILDGKPDPISIYIPHQH